MDVAYTFRYNGFVLQDQTLNLAERVWSLSNRVVLFDSTGIAWDIKAEPVSFYLPYTANVTQFVVDACNGFYNGTVAGHPGLDNSRLFGSAGIIGSQPDNRDVAAGWAPMFLNDLERDIVLANLTDTEAAPIYGTTLGANGPIFLSYWINPV